MADTPPQDDASPAAGAATLPQMRVIAQYVKDFSFENPGAPETLRIERDAPQIELGIDVQGRNAGGDAYEVALSLNAKAMRGDKVIFIAELTYGGLFELINFDERMREQVLLIECPRLLFPFARRMIADATRDGGFPPLLVEPVDFAGLYRQQRGQGGPADPAAQPPAGNA